MCGEGSSSLKGTLTHLLVKEGKRLEQLGITRRLKGSAGKEHRKTGTGLVESHIRLQKLTMRKTKASLQKRKILAEDEDSVTNSLPLHTGCSGKYRDDLT